MKVRDLLENDFENNDGKERSFWDQFRFILRKEKSLAHHLSINGQQHDNVIAKLVDTGETFNADDERAYEEETFKVGGSSKVPGIRYCLITPRTERFVNKLKELNKNRIRLGVDIRKYMIMKEKMKKDPLWNAGREVK